ncbi:MAG: ABC transporter permease, partial [Bacteroidaceae bacterium]|nr:ABC transporter permease [Bacteroidaceae bacterium]
MRLVWKLLRQHISVPQFVGFLFANLFGMVIVLVGFQFYSDVVPLFQQGDSFMREDYLIVSKKISTFGSVMGKTNTFSASDIDEIKEQPFTSQIGAFTPSAFKVSASMGLEGAEGFTTEMFFESVPDHFVDVSLDDWTFSEGDKEIPIIIPRNYLNMYNFGFAQSRSLPKVSEGLMGMIHFDISIRGNGKSDMYKGRIIGFSSRLNTILVPEKFMKWANSYYSADAGVDNEPSRMILEVKNPADENIAKFFQSKDYETEDNKL